MLLRHTCGLSLNAAVNVSDEYIYKKKKTAAFHGFRFLSTSQRPHCGTRYGFYFYNGFLYIL